MSLVSDAVGTFHRINAVILTIVRFTETEVKLGLDNKVEYHLTFDWGTKKKHHYWVGHSDGVMPFVIYRGLDPIDSANQLDHAMHSAWSNLIWSAEQDKERA